MYRPRHPRANAERRGVILLVVITMLTLFAVVGLTFLAYAESEATASRIYKEANDVIPDYYKYLSEQQQPYDFALGQLIYDVDDGGANSNLDSALRGHSLARTMYGWNDDFKAANSSNPNTVPYNGVGRVNTDGSTKPYMNPFTQNDFNLVNYMYHRGDNFIRDPERTYLAGGQPYRTDPAAAAARGLFTGGFNAPYTYPDHNNLFLAAVQGDGTVLVPSFHRPWLGAGDLATTNANFGTTAGPAWVKYTTLRPLPSQHSGFPGILINGGDVQNLPNANNTPDSIWIDLGHPVSTLPDGRRYKPMFAFLVRDLDGLLNINAHGNMALAGQEHAANQGWGAWEVSMRPVLHDAANPAEWKQLFLNPTFGRYRSTNTPYVYEPGTSGASLAANQAPRPGARAGYNGFDFDAAQTNMSGRVASTKVNTLIPTGMTTPFTGFPTLSGGYDNSGATELVNHPGAYNVFRPSDDQAWGIDNMLPLVGYGKKDTTEWQKSKLYTENAIRNLLVDYKKRNLITTHSADLDRIGASPIVWDPNATPLQLNAYSIDNPATWVPTSSVTFQSIQTRPTAAVPTGSEYRTGGQAATSATVDWRSALAEAGRLNLNIDFTTAPWAFPAPTGTPAVITDTATFQTALQKRQGLARAIFQRLQAATGAAQPVTGPATSPAYQANRWLAQLATNVVDYIDPDDYMTPFVWNPVDPNDPNNSANYASAELPNRVVFGTEMPRLVINEVYAQVDNDPADTSLGMDPTTARASYYKLNVWVELHNPLNNETNLSEGGNAVLYRDATCIPYQIVVASTNAGLRNPENVTGKPDPGTGSVYPGKPHEVTNLGTGAMQTVVEPAKGAFSGPVGENKGFYLAGPDATYLKMPLVTTPPDLDPAMTEGAGSPFGTPTAKTTSLSIKLEDPAVKPADPTILLRRLACEFLPANDPTSSTYDSSRPVNPYITVDYVENVQWRDRVEFDNAGQHDKALVGGWDHLNKPAVGKTQPYAGHSTQRRAQAPTGVATDGTKILHTFFRHNSRDAADAMGNPPTIAAGDTLKMPFDWLLHLDRPIQNPIELLHVSGFKPHELTQQFMIQNTTGAVRYAHQARWTEPNSRLFRFLELIETRDYASGVVPGGRVPGKINLNTIYDPEVFRALLGVDPTNATEVANADAIWNRFVATRTPGGLTPAGFGASSQHNPVTSFAIGGQKHDDYAGATGAHSYGTLLRRDANGYVLSQNGVTPDHPYLQTEVLRKIFNNTTVRSNVFAVWCTVGYFEVKDETTRPYLLGAEIGSGNPADPSDDRVFRSKFFAIVDRTYLAIDPDPATGGLKQAAAPPILIAGTTPLQAGANVTVPVPVSGGNQTDGEWSLQQNDWVVVGVGTTNQIWVQAGPGGTVTIPTLSSDIPAPYAIALPHIYKDGTGAITKRDTAPILPGNPGPQPAFQYNQAPYSGTVVRAFHQFD